MRTDLHIHTTASDGCWTPEQLINGISKQGIQLFAVTDHDSVDNVLATEALSHTIPAYFIRGVEMSTTFQGAMAHILGYRIDPKYPPLLDALFENRSRLESVDDKDIQKLIELGYPIKYSDYLSYNYDRTRGGWKSLNFLIDQNLCHGPTDFFDNIRSQIDHQWPTFLPLKIVINIIRDAGGIPLLAHPGASLPSDNIEDSLDLFYDQGIEGVECYAQYHDEKLTELCLRWCKRKGLLITGGSDYHGGFVNRILGKPILDHELDLNLGSILPQALQR